MPSQEILDLAKELLADIELKRISHEAMILKGNRLARLCGDEDIMKWLRYEMGGYYSGEYGEKLMTAMGRWTDRKDNRGYWGPLAEIEAQHVAYKLKISAQRVPDISGDHAAIAINNANTSLEMTARAIATFAGILSRAISRLHNFVVTIYMKYSLESSGRSIFEMASARVNAKYDESMSSVIEKIPVIIERLNAGDPEAISHALLSCRRLIDEYSSGLSFEQDSYSTGSETISVSADKTKNRIIAHVHRSTSSESRRKRLKTNLINLYEKVSAGVHADVGTKEAEYLFLNTYLLLGEVIQMSEATETPSAPQT